MNMRHMAHGPIFLIAILFSINTFSLGMFRPDKPKDPPTSPDQPRIPTPVPDPKPDPDPEPTPEPRPSLERARWESRSPVSNTTVWTDHTFRDLASLGPNLLDGVPADVSGFCPQYSRMSDREQRDFWVYLISSMTELESSHNPSTSYRENFRDGQGNFVISRGLLQISIESGNAYGCAFRSSQDLHDPFQNLSCGIRILNRWLGRDGRIAGKVNGSWKGGARYWSVLRTGSKLDRIQSWTRSFCSALTR